MCSFLGMGANRKLRKFAYHVPRKQCLLNSLRRTMCLQLPAKNELANTMEPSYSVRGGPMLPQEIGLSQNQNPEWAPKYPWGPREPTNPTDPQINTPGRYLCMHFTFHPDGKSADLKHSRAVTEARSFQIALKVFWKCQTLVLQSAMHFCRLLWGRSCPGASFNPIVLSRDWGFEGTASTGLLLKLAWHLKRCLLFGVANIKIT